MSRYRMIAIDFDGTLLTPSGEVTQRTRAAIHAAVDAGLMVCFATGRDWTESRIVLDAVGHYPLAVFVGGALVVDTQRQTTLHRTKIDPLLAAEACELLEDMGHACLALQDGRAAGFDYLISANRPLSEASRRWIEFIGCAVRYVPWLGKDKHEHTIRVGICTAPNDAETALKALEARCGPRAMCHRLAVPSYRMEVLEVHSPNVNKWQGLMHIARMHEILPEQIIAVGDDVNDLPMISNAGLGVAMANGHEQVRSAAARVIGSNENDGLAEFLEELVKSGGCAASAKQKKCDSSAKAAHQTGR